VTLIEMISCDGVLVVHTDAESAWCTDPTCVAHDEGSGLRLLAKTHMQVTGCELHFGLGACPLCRDGSARSLDAIEYSFIRGRAA
jgi:hypothetical protein